MEQLRHDTIIETHVAVLYDTMMEQNLCRLIEPFSRVEVAHLAKYAKDPKLETTLHDTTRFRLIGLPTTTVEHKLSKMILDKTISGVLDQGAGCLVVFNAPRDDYTYGLALDTMDQLGGVVDALYRKAQRLS